MYPAIIGKRMPLIYITPKSFLVLPRDSRFHGTGPTSSSFKVRRYRFRRSMAQIFFVVSFGSSGSWSLCKHLQRFGKAFHVHSRLPPTCLTSLGGHYNDGTKVYHEWFGDSNLSEQDYQRSKVIFILREPRSAYLSFMRRFHHKLNRQRNKGHFRHISVDWALRHNVTESDDPFGLHHFVRSWTNPSPDYDVVFVTYEALHEWSYVMELHKLLGISRPTEPVYKTRNRKYNMSRAPNHTALREMYDSLHPIRLISTKHLARSTCTHIGNVSR